MATEYYEPRQFLRSFVYKESEKKVYVTTIGNVELPGNETLTAQSFSSETLNAFSARFYIQYAAEAQTTNNWNQEVPVMENVQYVTAPTTEAEKIADIRTQIADHLETHNSAFFIITAVVKDPLGVEKEKASNTINASSQVIID